ncbi:protein kinase [Streptococcus ruminicola]|nr:protein kinase [Streptococcus ruminicola]
MTYSNYKKYLEFESEHQKCYENLLNQYCSLSNSEDNHWAYNMVREVKLEKGIKIHLSAHVLNAVVIAKMFFNFIETYNLKINFKILANLKELALQNSSIYGYSQVGKFITIYPNNDEELIFLLNKLENLYRGIKGVDIPSDFRYQLSEVVFYRYGEFIKKDDFIDKRDRKFPTDVEIPIEDYFRERFDVIPTKYIILEIINRNAKGGVYKVLNTESNRISVLKEAKNLSLLDFTNKDGVSRLMSERSILRDIEKENFSPKVFGDFYVKNSYFIEEEYIEGVPLINYKELQTNYSWFLNLIDNLELLNKKYNYTYRDLSFNNIIVSKEKKVYVIDFEHALSKTEFENEERVSLFGTPGFYETNLDLSEKQAEDILGIVYLLFWSQNLKEYRHFLNLDYIAAMEYIMTFEKDRYNKISSKERFYPIYKKAFNHEYRDFSELKSEFIQILEG